jgi:hypothetical protein
MKRKKSILRGLINSIFAFFLTLIFTVFFLCAGLSLGVFNHTGIIKNLNSSRYYYKAQEALLKSAQEAVTKAGLPSAIIADAISPEKVYIGGTKYIEAALQGKSTEINTMRFRTELTQKVNQYLTEQGITRTKELNDGIEALTTAMESEYVNTIRLSLLLSISKSSDDYYNLLVILIPLLILLTGILCYLLIRRQHYKHRGVRYITYALISSSLMILFAAGYLMITKSYDKINITPVYYKDFLTAYLKWDITVFLYIGSIGILFSFVLITFAEYLKNKITGN